ncbi:hypothetical protein ABH920_000979 [Catenulispora sp. EB89]|uniref:hypothetical protein n=1 Tax=Catenulispora sp. EB89 TaxID=3156257 RepID=UPI003516B7CF
MSEGQFAYNGFTLDELRSLASSPQVGTMQAMPQSFRALAERVGEVADLLTHAQADLPNWWKGPAAEQAAATLGRAAAEAREFHDSAMGAATAVGRCARVVAEQQHQMMNVPEVPEPGITDVVQRPKTPFEALEAARQDASYQAAHEQAVQVVNGIAAQYVETRGQLSNISFKFGENFTPARESNPPSPHSTPPQDADYQITAPPIKGSRLDGTPHLPPKNDISDHAATPITNRPSIPAESLSIRPPEPKSADPSTFESTLQRTATRNTLEQASADTTFTSTDSPATPETSRAKQSIKHEAPGIISDAFLDVEESPIQHYRAHLSSTTKKAFSQEAQAVIVDNGHRNTASVRNSRQVVSSDQPSRAAEPTSDSSSSTPPQATHELQLDGTNSENAEIIPPYSSPGSLHRAREERNPRPAYLKERKSAWLPDTAAAPADGVISPDWFEHL